MTWTKHLGRDIPLEFGERDNIHGAFIVSRLTVITSAESYVSVPVSILKEDTHDMGGYNHTLRSAAASLCSNSLRISSKSCSLMRAVRSASSSFLTWSCATTWMGMKQRINQKQQRSIPGLRLRSRDRYSEFLQLTTDLLKV